jgi:hypothetical protein
MKKRFLLLILLIAGLSTKMAAQSDSLTQQPRLDFSGFLDVFYAYDFNEPTQGARQGFFFNHNRHNEFNVNLALFQVQLDGEAYRAKVGLMAGTYAQDNLAAEQDLIKNIFEAYAGISLNKDRSLWLDAGIFTSHIGFESAISSDNWTLSRSLVAENSPYYLAGVKLTFDPNDQLTLAAVVSNGWQRIQRVQGNSLPGFGTQVNYHPTDKISLNWSTLIGSDVPDDVRRLRIFNNFFGQFQLSEKVGLIAGFDIGAEQVEKNSSDYDIWYGPVVITRMAVSDQWALGLRGEYYVDKNQIIIATDTPNGFQTFGASLNVDYAPVPNVLCRLEGRLLNSKDNIFERSNAAVNSNVAVLASMAVQFGG